MPHGTPDWGLVGPKATTYGLDDLGEHAVRLGSPVLWDRRGDVLVETDFRNGLGEITIQNVGIGGVVALCTGHSRTGAYSVQFIGDGENLCDQSAAVELPFPVLSKVGVEFSFCFQDWAAIWEVFIYWADRARAYQARVRVRPAVLLRDVAWYDGVYHPFGTGVALNQGDTPKHTMKLVVDLLNHEYVRFIIDDLPYSLLGNYADDIGGSAVSYLWAHAMFHRAGGDTEGAYVDNFIVTQNEP